MATYRRRDTSAYAANCTYHLCLTHCWLMRGSYFMCVDGKYHSEGDHYPWHTECPPLTSRIIPPPPYFKLSRAQNSSIVCYESQTESANEFNSSQPLGSVPPDMCNVTVPVRWGTTSTQNLAPPSQDCIFTYCPFDSPSMSRWIFNVTLHSTPPVPDIFWMCGRHGRIYSSLPANWTGRCAHVMFVYNACIAFDPFAPQPTHA